LLFTFPKHGRGLQRDYKWLGSHRHAIIHLGGMDRLDLRCRADEASQLFGWTAPYLDALPEDALAPPYIAPLLRSVVETT
jgi:hypothetical protein